MDIIYLLLPIALIIVAVMVWFFFWAVKSDQFEDLEGPAHRILMDRDDNESETDSDNSDGKK